MTIYDFCDLCTSEVEVSIYDLNTDTTVFEGDTSDAMYSGYADYELMSFDVDGNALCLNIEVC